LPISSISPQSSAIGMNSAGPIEPSSECRQRSSASARIGAQLELGLPFQRKLTPCHRVPQLLLDRKPAPRTLAESRHEELETPTAGRLGRIQSEVGIGQGLVDA